MELEEFMPTSFYRQDAPNAAYENLMGAFSTNRTLLTELKTLWVPLRLFATFGLKGVFNQYVIPTGFMEFGLHILPILHPYGI